MTKKFLAAAAIGAALLTAAPHAVKADPRTNAAIVTRAMHQLFVERDLSAIKRYWQNPYEQHNPMVPDGTASLAALVAHLPKNFRYIPGMIVAQGDLVMLHGQYIGFGPKVLDTVDIFRLERGKIVEHWDVMQPDVPASRTKSGNPMFSPNEAANQ